MGVFLFWLILAFPLWYFLSIIVGVILLEMKDAHDRKRREKKFLERIDKRLERQNKQD